MELVVCCVRCAVLVCTCTHACLRWHRSDGCLVRDVAGEIHGKSAPSGPCSIKHRLLDIQAHNRTHRHATIDQADDIQTAPPNTYQQVLVDLNVPILKRKRENREKESVCVTV